MPAPNPTKTDCNSFQVGHFPASFVAERNLKADDAERDVTALPSRAASFAPDVRRRNLVAVAACVIRPTIGLRNMISVSYDQNPTATGITESRTTPGKNCKVNCTMLVVCVSEPTETDHVPLFQHLPDCR